MLRSCRCALRVASRQLAGLKEGMHTVSGQVARGGQSRVLPSVAIPPTRPEPMTQTVPPSTEESLTHTLVGLRLSPQSLRPDLSRPATYRLPSATVHSPENQRILDPLAINRLYELPSHLRTDIEKVTPPLERVVPVEDPSRVPGVPVVPLETLPYLVNIRHRKMKKHKLKKFRKRMIFLHRKLAEIKKKKREKVMVAIEKEFATSAENFNAEEFIESNIREAKRGGWKVDVIKDWKNKKAASSTQESSQ